MHRARMRVALIVVVLAVLTGIGFLIGRTMVQQRRADDATAATMFAPDVAQSIREFHRVKVEDGRTVWDLRADKADFLDEGRVMVDVPEIAFFAEDGQSVHLTGATGEVTLEGPEVGRIDLRGGIEVTLGQYRLETPEASWVQSQNAVVATSGVDLRGGGVELTGDTMVVELGKRRVLVVGDVRTVLTRIETAESASTVDREPEEPAPDPDREKNRAGKPGGAPMDAPGEEPPHDS